MHTDGVKLLKLMFRPGETICPHHTKYAYHSIPLENAFKEEVTMVPRDPNRNFEYVSSDKLLLVALNPIQGFRNDADCTAYRNFLVEMDIGAIDEQLEYVKRYEIPYSAAIFSGNKSIHFVISLDQDLPSEKIYRFFSEWILNIITLADPNTKNPSRSVRIPGAERDPGKFQRLMELNGPVSLQALTDWLKRYPQSRPQEKKRRERIPGTESSFDGISIWAKNRLSRGFRKDKGRNKQWFSIACEFCLAGYTESATIDILSRFFEEEKDFKEKEWKIAIESAFKYLYNRK